MKRPVLALCLAPLVAVAALAQEKKDTSGDWMKALLEKRSSQRLTFAEPPAGWKARSSEGPKHFVCDYDVPADAGTARVNVLFFPLAFDEYRTKLIGNWTDDKGDPLKLEDQKVETLAEGDVTLRLVEQSGHKGGATKPAQRLVAVHVAARGEQWTAWLLGPEAAVEKARASYLAWVKTARVAAPETDAVREVRFVHGAPGEGVPGPWALAAYRIGKDALKRFGITREKAWEIVVTHRSPREVRYACMLDGLLAATGASPGKMNLVHEPVAGEEQLETVIVHKPSHRKLTYRLVKSFRDRIRETDYAQFPAAAKELDGLKDGEVFSVEESDAGK